MQSCTDNILRQVNYINRGISWIHVLVNEVLWIFTDRRRKRDFETERPDLSYLVGVRKGSVIGVYLDTNNPIQAIGETSNSNNNGVCRTTVSVSAMIIDCSNGSNVQDQILHAEAKISK